MYKQVIHNLQQAYAATAVDRDQTAKTDWKVQIRQDYLQQLQREQKTTFLEIGAGTGTDSKFFHDNGLNVTATDLTPAMVKLCRQKGLTAHVMDFLHLDFPPGHFDAVYALNCLLHVPKADLPAILQAIQQLMKPGGLFFLGQYGGVESEAIWEEDQHEPKRFFALYRDQQLKTIVSQFFVIDSFQTLDIRAGKRSEMHFQRFVLRRPEKELS